MRIALIFLLSTFAAGTALADCESKQERIAWARERMYPTATVEQLQQLALGLRMATNSCSDVAELWYYRSLVLAKLGKPDPYVVKKLKEFPPPEEIRQSNPLEAPPQLARHPLSPYVREKWALLIGIQEFQDKSIPGLQFAANDAIKLSEVLKGPAGRFDPTHVKVLTNKEANKTAILTALGDIRDQAKEDDLVFVYISSHGLSGDSDVTGVSYVITTDTDISRGATRYATSLPMVELSDFSRMLKAQRFVLVLDTCFGGGAITQSKAVVPLGSKPIDSFTGSLHGMESGSGRAVIAASRSTEQSWESIRFKNGYFTHFLIEALQQHDGLDNLKAVYSYVTKKVSDAVREDVHQNQNPVLDHTEKGDEIVLGVAVKK